MNCTCSNSLCLKHWNLRHPTLPLYDQDRLHLRYKNKNLLFHQDRRKNRSQNQLVCISAIVCSWDLVSDHNHSLWLIRQGEKRGEGTERARRFFGESNETRSARKFCIFTPLYIRVQPVSHQHQFVFQEMLGRWIIFIFFCFCTFQICHWLAICSIFALIYSSTKLGYFREECVWPNFL